MTTLLVDYSVGSVLKTRVQQAEDAFSDLVGGGRVRVIEKGGEVLSNLLGRNDPWAAKRSCKDVACEPCKARVWLAEQRKAAKKEGQDLPPCLLTKSSHQCRREGHNYSLQCLQCALKGVKSVYWGESSRSPRQRLKEHFQDCEAGLVTAPMVQHSLEAHGGTKPHYLGLINQVENRPLYRVVRESVQISMMAPGIPNINRCQEWGAPRVPVLSAVGGDSEENKQQNLNPRPLWSRDQLEKIKNGQIKRIKYWDEAIQPGQDPVSTQANPASQRPCKRPRTDQDPGPDLEAEGHAAVPGEETVRTTNVGGGDAEEDSTSAWQCPGTHHGALQAARRVPGADPPWWARRLVRGQGRLGQQQTWEGDVKVGRRRRRGRPTGAGRKPGDHQGALPAARRVPGAGPPWWATRLVRGQGRLG